MTVIRDLPADQYHAIKALSAGMIWTLDSECAAKAWLASPWNPAREAETAPHFDVGTAAHLAVLEPHLFDERVVAHGFKDYRSRAAQAARDSAYAAGKTPLKPEEHQIVLGMREAITRHPEARDLFSSGDAEISMSWDWNGLPCKLRADYLPSRNETVVDLKTAITCNPQAVQRKIETEGWFVRAAWYLSGVEEATGIRPISYKFVVVEKDPPHLCEVFELDDNALLQGEQIIMRALKTAKECFRAQRWPTYSGRSGGVIRLSRPNWARFQHADREAEGEFGQ